MKDETARRKHEAQNELDRTEGIRRKYRVERLGDPLGKHGDCDYFVLDWRHDPFAIPAALAYADACQSNFPILAADLRRKASERGSPADG